MCSTNNQVVETTQLSSLKKLQKPSNIETYALVSLVASTVCWRTIYKIIVKKLIINLTHFVESLNIYVNVLYVKMNSISFQKNKYLLY